MVQLVSSKLFVPFGLSPPFDLLYILLGPHGPFSVAPRNTELSLGPSLAHLLGPDVVT